MLISVLSYLPGHPHSKKLGSLTRKLLISHIYDNHIKFEVSLHFWWIWPTVWYPKILRDQLTLSQPRGSNYAHQMILAPLIFRPSNSPVIESSDIQRMPQKLDKNLPSWLHYFVCFLKVDDF